MRAPDVSMRPRDGPKAGLRRSAPNPPVIGSLRSGGNAQPSRLAARPRAGTNDCKTSSGRSAPSPAAGAAAASTGKAAPTAPELP